MPKKTTVENEPLIPATTKFVLTTNSTYGTSRDEDGEKDDVVELNPSAYGRYFERPEVQRAYREQLEIQTPEFTQLPDDAIVGGRFRPRSEEVSNCTCFFSVCTINLLSVCCDARNSRILRTLRTRNDTANTRRSRSDNVCAKRKSSNMNTTN